jgi:5-methylcytosine-specific restriction protein A
MRMQLREMLVRVGAEFPVERQKPLAENVLARFLRGEALSPVREVVGDGFMVQGSPGQGNWAEVPWVACFYPVVTASATRGYYVVYLFHSDSPKVTLSLNQGATAVRDEFGGRAGLEVLRDRAAIIRQRISDFAVKFVSTPIHLGASGSLPRGYEAGHAFGRTYDLQNLPNNELLQKDLMMLCEAYLALQFRGGLDPSPENQGGQGTSDERGFGDSVEEIRRYRVHRALERNPKAARIAKKGRVAECECCGFSFSQVYGALGAGYIEAHHRKPLHTLTEGEAVQYRPEDFALLCSNCHRMIHRLQDPSDLQHLIGIVNSSK